MQIRVTSYTSTPPHRIFDKITTVEVGATGELMLGRGIVTFLIIAHGKWDNVEILDPGDGGTDLRNAYVPSPEGMLREFHSVFPAMNDDTLRIRLLKEEVKELADAMAENDLVEIADGVADIVYVAIGTAVVKGIPFDRVFAEVHRSNMTKLEPNGQPKLRADGKVLKGKNFERPRLKPILQQEGLLQ